MMHRFAACLAISSLTFLAPRPADATPITHTLNTVDAVELTGVTYRLVVTGIRVGQTTTTTLTFDFGAVELAAQCQRFALIAMSKPGKYRLSVGGDTSSSSWAGSCKLILQTP